MRAHRILPLATALVLILVNFGAVSYKALLRKMNLPE